MAELPNSVGRTARIVIVGIVVFILVLWLNPFVIVGPGERGVVIRLGDTQDRVLDEGLHFRIPLVEKIVTMDVKTHKIEVDAPSYSKDLQDVKTKIALNYHLDPDKVYLLWKEIGPDYEARIISPAIQESVKAATAKFTAAELVSERPKVKEEIKSSLLARLHIRYMEVDDFSIVDFNFSDVYENAVEQKQVAEQEALKAQNDLRRIQVEAEQRVAQARAEAEAIKIQTEALRENQNLVKLEAVKKWNGVLPYTIMGNAVPFVDISMQGGGK